ncbi:hypothetical protein TEA_020460 [Camellia sinensis var. sinensis]|uniref:Gnk2-homologous domain-containing protein n=1 Tax=Camellia sinensis var. sinensis TaxID=542762 RepID=A0A4V3WJH7_CAMSN|nr:hypothetical protein TEA_020460 [Camellia sinensis var. sinensis]
MESLSQLFSSNHWAYYVINSIIFGLFQCFEDLPHTDCLLCFATSRTRIPHCLPSISARIYLDGCFLRYESFDFFNQSVDSAQDTVNCATDVVRELGFESRFGEVISDVIQEAVVNGGFAVGKEKGVYGLAQCAIFEEVISDVIQEAVVNGGFAVGKEKGVYGLAQCWRSVSSGGCRDCLEKAAGEVRRCVPSREGRGLNAGCYLRYSTVKFFNGGEKLQRSSG